jgi:hypothetical protein
LLPAMMLRTPPANRRARLPSPPAPTPEEEVDGRFGDEDDRRRSASPLLQPVSHSYLACARSLVCKASCTFCGLPNFIEDDWKRRGCETWKLGLALSRGWFLHCYIAFQKSPFCFATGQVRGLGDTSRATEGNCRYFITSRVSTELRWVRR